MHDVITTVTLLRFGISCKFSMQALEGISPPVGVSQKRDPLYRQSRPPLSSTEEFYQIMQELTANYSIIQLERCTFERLKHS